jgi:hypothetical protein
MRTLLLLSLLTAGTTEVFGQTQPAQPAPRQAQPAQPAPAAPRAAQPARRAPANARSGIALTVTDPSGATLEGVRVQLLGATERSGETNASGQVNFPGLQAGTYRARFSGDAVIAFEREIVVRAGQVANLDITLNLAPEPPAPPPPPPVAAPAPAPLVGPTGEPQALSVPDLLEKEFVGSQPRRETLLSCSGNTRTTMIQLNMPLPDRLYEAADAAYYVIGGEGSARIDGQERKLATNAFVSIPRGTPHSFTRAGRRPLILLAVLSGEPCEEPR